MSIHYLRIYYGTVESFNLSAEHKPQFLKGLRVKLQKIGYRVDLVPIDYINHCIIECCGHTVFKCNIKSLCFNTPAELDAVCMNAVDAVQEASVKLTRARNYLWVWMLIDKQIFNRSESAPHEHWAADIIAPLHKIESLHTCADCCGILRTKTKHATDEVVKEAPLKFFPDFGVSYDDSEYAKHLEELADEEVANDSYFY